MKPRRRAARRAEAQLAFEALTIEGGLLSPDWLSRAAQLAAGGQSEADYRIPKGLNLRDEIGRFWRIAQAHREFRTKRVILEIYDAMAEAARTGKPYQTRLDPPPADPHVAHPDTRPAAGKRAKG